jgi:hypothetical protein
MSYVLYFLHVLSFIYSHCVFCWGAPMYFSEVSVDPSDYYRRVRMASLYERQSQSLWCPSLFFHTLRSDISCVQMSIRSCCRSRAVMDRSSIT